MKTGSLAKQGTVSVLMGREEDKREKNVIFHENSCSSRSSLSKGATGLLLDFCSARCTLGADMKGSDNSACLPIPSTWRNLTVPPLLNPHLTLLLCHSTSWHKLGLEMSVNICLQNAPSLPKSHREGRSEQKPDINSVGMNACSPCWHYITTWSVHLSELKVQVKLILFTVVQDYQGVKVSTVTF